MIDLPLRTSVIGKARDRGLINLELINIRDFAEGPHRCTDDTPYGGGSGMVMKPEPVVRALESISPDIGRSQRLLLGPGGRPLSQKMISEWASLEQLILVCGRYEGIDERVRHFVDEEISIGDIILSGGEPAAVVIIDAVGRLLPGVLGNHDSTQEESFSDGLLEYPQYTRPREYRGHAVPEVLLSGDHQSIRRWRKGEALKRTCERRADLFEQYWISDEDQELLDAPSASPEES